jgi:hypothetical protein
MRSDQYNAGPFELRRMRAAMMAMGIMKIAKRQTDIDTSNRRFMGSLIGGRTWYDSMRESEVQQYRYQLIVSVMVLYQVNLGLNPISSQMKSDENVNDVVSFSNISVLNGNVLPVIL